VGIGFGEVCLTKQKEVRGPEKHAVVQNPVEQIKKFCVFERYASVHKRLPYQQLPESGMQARSKLTVAILNVETERVKYTGFRPSLKQ